MNEAGGSDGVWTVEEVDGAGEEEGDDEELFRLLKSLPKIFRFGGDKTGGGDDGGVFMSDRRLLFDGAGRRDVSDLGGPGLRAANAGLRLEGGCVCCE